MHRQQYIEERLIEEFQKQLFEVLCSADINFSSHLGEARTRNGGQVWTNVCIETICTQVYLEASLVGGIMHSLEDWFEAGTW